MYISWLKGFIFLVLAVFFGDVAAAALCNMDDYELLLSFSYKVTNKADVFRPAAGDALLGFEKAIKSAVKDVTIRIIMEQLHKHHNGAYLCATPWMYPNRVLHEIYNYEFHNETENLRMSKHSPTPLLAAIQTLPVVPQNTTKTAIHLGVLFHSSYSLPQNVEDSTVCGSTYQMDAVVKAIQEHRTHFFIAAKTVDLWDPFLKKPDIEEFYHPFYFSEQKGSQAYNEGQKLAHEVLQLACDKFVPITETPTTETPTTETPTTETPTTETSTSPTVNTNAVRSPGKTRCRRSKGSKGLGH